MPNIMKAHIIILAAGKGTRMQSDKPKVLAELANKPLLGHVLDTAKSLSPDSIQVVVGHGAEQITSLFKTEPLINWCTQSEQLGTGHAVKVAMPDIPDEDTVLILYGDVPFIQAPTLTPLLDNLNTHELSLLTAHLDDPSGYGRITRDPNQRVNGIVEQKDATNEQLAIDEINTGILAARAKHLKSWLERINNNNAQQEYYLTDIVKLAYQDRCEIFATQATDVAEIAGINNKLELARSERILQTRLSNDYMQRGLQLMDPNRFDVRGSLEFGRDCWVDTNVIINGQVTLGNNVMIHANCILSDCKIADNSIIHPNSVLESCTIGQHVNIGPFARIRPGTQLSDAVRIGNFVELKNTQLSHGSKVNHLSYVGDSEVGSNTNIGAGVITCNYDGANKHKTIIGDNAFIGSNAQLVAPVKINDNATIAAGSTITNEVPSESLAVARSKQRNLAGWQRPVKNSDNNK